MSVVGNLIGLSSHRYPAKTFTLGSYTLVFADELDVRDEWNRRRDAGGREHWFGDKPEKAAGFHSPDEKLIWCKWNWNGTVPDLDTLGHEILHAIGYTDERGRPWEEKVQ